jgi:hypothetical protein
MAEKLNYILENYISASEVTRAFGFKSNTMISNMRKGQTNIATLHLEGLEKHFNIPMRLFDYDICSKEEIDRLIETYQKKKIEDQEYLPHNFFKKDKKLLKKLKGRWYAYLYPSNPQSAKKSEGVWIVQTDIEEDYTIVDEYGNRGILRIGENQSLILKKSYEHQDITIIRFHNRQVTFNLFRFIIISTQNGYENEMINFGFYSRTKYSPTEAKEILGDISKVQLKLDLEFNDRVMKRVIIK